VLSTIAASHTASLLHGACSAAQRAGALTAGFDRGFMIAAVIPLAAALIVALVIPRIKRQGTPENAAAPEETIL
jgi:hypothetical protein